MTDDQQAQWSRTFTMRPEFLGGEPSEPGRAALARFTAAGATEVLELGAGQGRDTLLFAAAGLRVTALDYAAPGLAQIVDKAAAADLPGTVDSVVADVREPLPLADGTFDGAYAHMLLSMDLTTGEIERLVGEIHRVLRPGGLLAYTVRNTADSHYRAGIDRGDDRYEVGGFVVHFFDRSLVERLASGFELLEIADYEEGPLPRRLFGVTMRNPYGQEPESNEQRATDRQRTA